MLHELSNLLVRYTRRPLSGLNNYKTINEKLGGLRTYARYLSRRPKAIVNEHELHDPEDTTTLNFIKNERTVPLRKRKPKKAQEPPAAQEKKTERFTILKENDRILMNLMTRVRTRKVKEKNEEIVLEGHRMITEGLKAGVEPVVMLFNNPSDIDALELPNTVRLYKVPYRALQLWSNLSSCPGLMGIFKTPDLSKNTADNNAIPVTIICDNVRDPGNLGSILRAAAGVGCEKLILLKGCVDLWNIKVMRTAAGAHFRMPIHTYPTWDEIPDLISEHSNIFVADSNFGDKYLPQYSPDIRDATMKIFNLDPMTLKTTYDVNNDGTNVNAEAPVNQATMKKFLLKLPIFPYYSLDYTKNESVIVLSGETQGLSHDAYNVLNRGSIRVNIPLANEVDSLNTGVALGIVTFEIKRQFLGNK